jgi:glycosyltransferase involved in cell wall biosynthesis
VKEIVARLNPQKYRVLMVYDKTPDERIARRPNTVLLPLWQRGNAAYWLMRCLLARPDVYFFPREGPLDSAFLSVRRRLLLRIALVTYVVTTVDQVVPSLTLERSILEGDVVAGNSIYCSQTITQRFGVPTATVHDGVSTNIFFPKSDAIVRDPAALTVLYAGTFQARKRIHLVIEEAAKWPNVRFRLAGSGEEEPACRALVESLGCRNVEFLGHLSPEKLGDEMRRADVFLFPSRLEGNPQVLVQAAACGLPCIAMDYYRSDYVVNDKTGFLVPSDAELSQKLELLLTQPDLRQSMSKAAYQHSLQFNWDSVTEQWEKLFESAIARRQGSD